MLPVSCISSDRSNMASMTKLQNNKILSSNISVCGCMSRERNQLSTNIASPSSPRLLTSSGRRPMTSSGNKIVVYETKKLKALKAESKKKRAELEGEDMEFEMSPSSRGASGSTARPGTSAKRPGTSCKKPTTSLPPLKERQRLRALEKLMREVMPEDEVVSVAIKDDPRREGAARGDWMRCESGGSAWDVGR